MTHFDTRARAAQVPWTDEAMHDGPNKGLVCPSPFPSHVGMFHSGSPEVFAFIKVYPKKMFFNRRVSIQTSVFPVMTFFNDIY